MDGGESPLVSPKTWWFTKAESPLKGDWHLVDGRSRRRLGSVANSRLLARGEKGWCAHHWPKNMSVNLGSFMELDFLGGGSIFGCRINIQWHILRHQLDQPWYVGGSAVPFLSSQAERKSMSQVTTTDVQLAVRMGYWINLMYLDVNLWMVSDLQPIYN